MFLLGLGTTVKLTKVVLPPKSILNFSAIRFVKPLPVPPFAELKIYKHSTFSHFS
jgi:hypothetical protein